MSGEVSNAETSTPGRSFIKRCLNWNDHETKSLVNTMKHYKKKFFKLKRKGPIYKSIYEDLQICGVNRTLCEVITKVKNLLHYYRKYKALAEENSEPPTWEYFDDIKEFVDDDSSTSEDQRYSEDHGTFDDEEEEAAGSDTGKEDTSIIPAELVTNELLIDDSLDMSNEVSPCRRSSEHWFDRETSLLLLTLKDYKEEYFQHGGKIMVYASISEVLKIFEVKRSPEEISNKIKNLLRKFRKEKSLFEQTSNPSEWRFYTEMSDFFDSDSLPDGHQFSENPEMLDDKVYEPDLEINSDNSEIVSEQEAPSEISSTVHHEGKTSTRQTQIFTGKGLKRKYSNVCERKSADISEKKKKSISDILEDVLSETKLMRQQAMTRDKELLIAFKKQNELLERLLLKF